MKCFKNILKISIILILLIVSVGSIYAADNSQNSLADYQDDDLDLDDELELDDDSDEDEDFDDDSDWDDDLDDEDFDDDSDWDDDFDDEDFYDDMDDEDLEDDFDDELMFDDLDENDTDMQSYYQSFDYLNLKTLLYLERYGNATENWTETEHFLNEYQIYLQNPSNYTLNESLEGYQTYLKIFDSITSTFDDYNLTENETEYIKFLIIYYLNNYGNVSANYTWNESDEFSTFFPLIYDIASCVLGLATSYEPIPSNVSDSLQNLNAPMGIMLNNSTSTNVTSNSNGDSVFVPPVESNDWGGIVVLILVVVLVGLVFI